MIGRQRNIFSIIFQFDDKKFIVFDKWYRHLDKLTKARANEKITRANMIGQHRNIFDNFST
jgi:hypothetical protein